MSEPKEVFFYTESYPHQWSSGPVEYTSNPNGWKRIESLEEAKELAEKKATHGIYNESRCVTTYGVKTVWTVPDKKDLEE